MMRFKDKVALVSGGASGIGKAIALRLQEEGARVMTVQRSVDPVHEHIAADLIDQSQPAQVINEVVKRSGKLDFLINNAGMMTESTVESMSLDDWQRTLALNLTAPMLLIKAALPHLRATSGNIVNVGSIEAFSANPLHAAYCASKSGLHGLTRAVAVDHGPEGIRCNAVAPGWIDTELNENFISASNNPSVFRREIGGIHPLDRTGKPEEVAAVVAFLLAEESSFITGQVYTVDGGRMAKLSLP